ncbi:rod-binding protein [uncultured Cohaesibacter sp.]|uniref:rod-binding protein n=1 Tax=uncultured Cohaesibacter sp. TaxID=1002546 RepID=UPI00292DD24C|nr:rod-binding protein [uncultured Cohaesibacter sp.]
MASINAAPFSITQGNGIQSNLSNEEQARQAAQEFEGVFISQMLSNMFEGVGETGLTGGSYASSTYQSLLTETYADEITKSGGIGIADSVMRELLSLQEMNPTGQ